MKLRNFIIRILVFLLPIGLLLSPVLCSGELVNSGTVALLQHTLKIPALYGPLYSESQYQYYKAESTRIKKPEVLIMGDSRALQIHDFFFNENVTMYNIGYAVTTTADMQYFLECCDVSSIDTVIISLSHFSFNANYIPITYPDHDSYLDHQQGKGCSFAYTAKQLLKELWSGDYSAADIITTVKNPWMIGLNAKRNQSGILNSGAYYYGKIIEDAAKDPEPAKRLQDTLERIETGSRRFQYADTANQDAFVYLQQFLDYCEETGIYVIAYAPPYAPSVNAAMEAMGNCYGYQTQMLQIVPQLFAGYENAEFYDYTDVTALGCTDDYFLDGFHGSDVVFLRMINDMIARGSRLGQLCDAERLQEYNNNRSSDLSLLPSMGDYMRKSGNEK